MPYTIKITPEAFNDLQKAIDYYNEQKKGLGKKFNTSILTILTTLKKTPATGSFIYANFRYRVIHNFPYIITYEITPNNTIIIARIFNTNLNPYWQ